MSLCRLLALTFVASCTAQATPELKIVDGNLHVVLPFGKQMIVKSGVNAGVDLENIPSLISELSTSTDAAVIAAQNASNAHTDASITTTTEVLQQAIATAVVNAVGTLRGEIGGVEDRLTKALDKTKADLQAKVTELERTKASLADQVILSKKLTTETGRLDGKIDDVDEEFRHQGGNLVLSSDLQNTQGVWDQALENSLAEYDTFVDGLPIRVTSSREVKSDPTKSTCYPGWGRTNKFKVDPQKTYEFSIWIRSTVHQSKMANYFGFTLFFENGTAINSQTNVENYQNPYFKSSRGDTSEWTKHYGYLIGSDYVNTKFNDSFSLGAGCTLYTCPGGTNPIRRDSTMFRAIHPMAGYALLRFGSCYAENNGNDNVKYTLPMVRELEATRATEAEKVGHFADRSFTLSNNLVRHSNLLRTEVGPRNAPAYGGDSWAQRPILELVQFDGFGTPTPIVASRSAENGGGSCYSGWGVTNFIKVVPTNKYEFSIWIRSSDPGMNNYFGFYAYDGGYNRITGLYGNPYFKCSDNDSDDWVKYTGYLVPRTSQNIRDYSCGLAHTTSDGSHLATYGLNSNVRYVQLRYGSCYSNGDGRGVTHYAFPSVKLTVGK
eukprot:m.74161 g.74161  ORF g.74161 m.74161 type:complete len:607 (-) comp24629_c0_seq1:446-2266(-)